MLIKDVLALVFDQLENGYDLLNFGEINKMCYKIWTQKIEVRKNYDGFTMYGSPPLISAYTSFRRSKKLVHGIYRKWRSEPHVLECENHYFHGKKHGFQYHWGLKGLKGTYHYQNNRMHGLQFSWHESGPRLKTVCGYTNGWMYAHLQKIQIQLHDNGTFKSAYDQIHKVWYTAQQVYKK